MNSRGEACCMVVYWYTWANMGWLFLGSWQLKLRCSHLHLLATMFVAASSDEPFVCPRSGPSSSVGS